MQRVLVLIVEDDSDLRQMFRAALSLAGYDVVQAGDGVEALRQLDASDIACVVLDLGLPGISGYTVLEEVAAHAHTHHVPVVVVVTGLPGPHDRLTHASCVLAKPVTPEHLVSTVRRCMAAGTAQGA